MMGERGIGRKAIGFLYVLLDAVGDLLLPLFEASLVFLDLLLEECLPCFCFFPLEPLFDSTALAAAPPFLELAC